MSSVLTKCSEKYFLVGILVSQIIVNIMVLFDVPVVRQTVVFIYLTFVPGLIIVKLLGLNELDRLETVLFSVGLSVAFLLIGGLLLNVFGFLAGISEPLSLMPLLTLLNGFILVGGITVYLRSDEVNLPENKTRGLHPLALLLIGLPVLTILGTLWVNAFNDNSILLFMMVVISSLFVMLTIYTRSLPSKLYSLAVLMIAVSLLYHSALISNYIVPAGSDVPAEHFVFKSTLDNGYWSSTNPYFETAYGRLHSMLSITILPTAYSTLLNMNSTWVFKLLFPLLFSFVPLGLYQLWRRYLGNKYAFISAFLFMAQATFYTEMLGLNRQMIAELFFVLLLLVILNKKLKQHRKVVYFTIFGFGLVTSHYGLSEIFLFFIAFSFLLLFLLKKSSRKITASMIILFFVLMFTWYIYTSEEAVFHSILEFGNYVYSQLGDFFNPASRGQTVLRGLGLESPTTMWNALSRAFAYATQFFIVVGFVGLITKRAKIHFEKVYFALSFVAMAFLAALILVPGLANMMNMTRFYHILLFFLAPLCVIGAGVIVSFVSRRRKKLLVSILLLLVLVPYFLFQTGFVYEVTESDSWSIPLSKHRMDALRLYGGFGYIDAYSVFGAQWLSENVDVRKSKLYADSVSQNYVLTIYGMIYKGYVNELSNITVVADNGTVYLSTLNVVHGKISYYGRVWNTSELSFILDDLNKVYTNGGSEIYKNTP
jgi:uncharacterized membrane protein